MNNPPVFLDTRILNMRSLTRYLVVVALFATLIMPQDYAEATGIFPHSLRRFDTETEEQAIQKRDEAEDSLKLEQAKRKQLEEQAKKDQQQLQEESKRFADRLFVEQEGRKKEGEQARLREEDHRLEARKLATQLDAYRDVLKKLNRAPGNGGKQNPTIEIDAPILKVSVLVIGNSHYKMSPLENTINDATAIGELFGKFGYDVDVLIDGTRQKILEALARLKSRGKSSDLAILFYAGHGVQMDNVNYLIPVDFDPNHGAEYFSIDTISVNDVIENYLPTKARLVFLDACRNNPFGAVVAAGGRNLTVHGLAPMPSESHLSASGTLIAYATKDGSVALDGKGRHSPYTQALLNHLNDKIDISLVLRRVRQTVIDNTAGQQLPWEYGSLVGDELILAR